MQVLITSPYTIDPPGSGSAVRTHAIVRELDSLGDSVTLLSAERGNPRAAGLSIRSRWLAYAPRGRAGHFCNPGFWRRLGAELKRGPDALIASSPLQAFMIVPLARRFGVPVVYDAHNAEAARFKQTAGAATARFVYLAERHLCRHAAAVYAVSDGDIALFQRLYGCKAGLFPNGVDVRRFTPGPRDGALEARYGIEGAPTVLYFGTFDYGPNVDALRFLVELWPAVRAACAEARLLVVGRNPPSWANAPGVVATGFVMDIVPFIRLADVVAVPLAMGGGTRLKIVESLACGVPVVSTPLGAEGITPKSNAGILLRNRNQFGETLIAHLKGAVPKQDPETIRAIAVPNDWSTLVRQFREELMADIVFEAGGT